MATAAERLEWLFRFLEQGGFKLIQHGKGTSYKILSPSDKQHPLRPVLIIAPEDFNDYIESRIDHSLKEFKKDPEEDALGLASLNILEEISVDHGGGYNYTRSLGFRRKNGVVEFFIDSHPPIVEENHEPESPLEWTAERPNVKR